MYSKFIIFLLIFNSFHSFSQNTITGIVKENNEPYSHLEIVLYKNVPIESVFTDEHGLFQFKVEKGNYKLEGRLLGKILFTRDVVVSDDLNLGDIEIESTQELSEVVVTARKNLIERKVDRLVFNVENSIAASGGDALDALKVTPGITVNNDQIAMIGKGNLNVMINDRLVNLSGSELTNFLNSLKSDDIKKIEVITSPPARYDAQGNSGLINIVTKSVKTDSFYGSIRGGISQANKNVGSGGINLNYQKNKSTITSSINYANGSVEPFQNYTLKYPNYIWIEDNNKRNFINNLSGRFTYDYRINQKTRIGAEYNISNVLPLVKSYNESKIYNPSKVLDSIISTQSRIEMNRLTNAINLYSIIDVDTLGKKLNIDLDYVKYNSKSENTFFSNSFLADGTIKPNNFFSANNSSNLDIDIITTRIDMDYPTKFAKLNFGSKLTFINNLSGVKFYNTTSGSPTLDPLQTNDFEYNENIQALYISGSKNLTKSLELQIGLRGEYTQTIGNSLTLTEKTTNDYFNLFPTLFLNHNINEYKSLSFNYNKRINRPSYNNLNPFRFYSTPFNFAEGNPFLQPSFSDNFEISFVYKNSYSMFYVSHINDGFDQVTLVEPNSITQRVFPINFYNQLNTGFYQGYSFNLKNVWENNSNVSVFYTKTNSKSSNVLGVEAWSGSIRTNNAFILDKNKRFRAELNFNYQLPSIAGSYELSSFYQLDLGLRGNFLNNKLNVIINGVDVFKTNKQTFSQTVNNIQQENFDYRDVRRVRLTVVYNFGKSFKMNKKSEANKDEKSRIN